MKSVCENTKLYDKVPSSVTAVCFGCLGYFLMAEFLSKTDVKFNIVNWVNGNIRFQHSIYNIFNYV